MRNQTSSALGRSGKREAVNITDRVSAEAAIDIARLRVVSAIKDVWPVWVSAGLSGGHDSVTATYIASLASDFNSAFHIATGVGLQATEDYVSSLCKNQRWPLEVFKAVENTQGCGKSDPMDYFALVEKHGFPGPGQHRTMYIKLKERAVRRWVRAHKKKHSREVLMLVSGARRQESARRGSINGSNVTDARWDDSLPVYWVNPLWDFSKLDCTRIMEHAKLPRSPVVDFIHKSGECLCGCFGKPGELKETAMWFPSDPTVIRLLEANKRHCLTRGWGWSDRPVKKCAAIGETGPMCSSCDAARLALRHPERT